MSASQQWCRRYRFACLWGALDTYPWKVLDIGAPGTCKELRAWVRKRLRVET